MVTKELIDLKNETDQKINKLIKEGKCPRTASFLREIVARINKEIEKEMKNPKLFYVVFSPTKNSEIFETREEARDYLFDIRREFPKHEFSIRIAEVRNYYQEEDGQWNYEDKMDTFTFINQNNINKFNA